MPKRKINKRIWQSWEIEALTLLYPHKPTLELAKALNRRLCSIYNKALSLGLKKSESFLNSPESGRLTTGKIIGPKTCFPKGHVPFNKGKKQTEYMTPEKINLSAKTQFGKGHLPHNTKQDGDTSIRRKGTDPPYVFERVALGKWLLQHRLRWEREYGPIPKGGVLRCKTKDTLNTNPDNWELIDRRKHAIRNSGAINLPDTYIASLLAVRQPELKQELLKHPELLGLARSNYLLKREIKNGSEKS